MNAHVRVRGTAGHENQLIVGAVPSNMIKRTVNDYEVRMFGLQRSGMHGIVNWIVQQAMGTRVFVNDIGSLLADPFQPGSNVYISTATGNSRSVPQDPSFRWIPKQYLILGYEDTDLRQIPVGLSELLGENIGPSRAIINILVIRDPFNLFASRLSFANDANRLPLKQNGERVKNLWKMHAHECLGHTRFLTPAAFVIRYNQWFVDPIYRREIAENLGLAFTDSGLNAVPGVGLAESEFPRFGCGSSFDNVRFHGRAQEMSVLRRWEQYAADPFFISLVDDTELFSLSLELFGPIAGIKRLQTDPSAT